LESIRATRHLLENIHYVVVVVAVVVTGEGGVPKY
jgi:hypothetical protein